MNKYDHLILEKTNSGRRYKDYIISLKREKKKINSQEYGND